MKLVVENQQVNEYHKMEEDLYRNKELFQAGRTSGGKKKTTKNKADKDNILKVEKMTK